MLIKWTFLGRFSFYTYPSLAEKMPAIFIVDPKGQVYTHQIIHIPAT